MLTLRLLSHFGCVCIAHWTPLPCEVQDSRDNRGLVLCLAVLLGLCSRRQEMIGTYLLDDRKETQGRERERQVTHTVLVLEKY